MGNHRNSRTISRIDHLDPTKRLDLRGGFEMISMIPPPLPDNRFRRIVPGSGGYPL